MRGQSKKNCVCTVREEGRVPTASPGPFLSNPEDNSKSQRILTPPCRGIGMRFINNIARVPNYMDIVFVTNWIDHFVYL